MWMVPLYLHINQKSNDDDFDNDGNNDVCILSVKYKESESKYFTGDTSTDIHSPGPTIAKRSH